MKKRIMISITISIFSLFINVAIAKAIQRSYNPENEKTGIALYNYGDDWISVQFKTSSKVYTYTADVYGQQAIDNLKSLADTGKNLNKKINELRKLEKDPNYKIQNTPHMVYCGPAGGQEPKTYPIPTRAKARAALTYARWANDPKGIQECVCKWYPDFPICKKIHNKK